MGSKSFSINGLDLQAVKRTLLRGLGGVAIAVIPLAIDPSISYVAHLHGHDLNLTALVALVGTGVVRLVEQYLSNNQ